MLQWACYTPKTTYKRVMIILVIVKVLILVIVRLVMILDSNESTSNSYSSHHIGDRKGQTLGYLDPLGYSGFHITLLRIISQPRQLGA